MAVYLWDNGGFKPLVVDGKIAVHEDCCCFTVPCCPGVTLPTTLNLNFNGCGLNEDIVLTWDGTFWKRFSVEIGCDGDARAAFYFYCQVGGAYDGQFGLQFNNFLPGGISCMRWGFAFATTCDPFLWSGILINACSCCRAGEPGNADVIVTE